MEMNNSSDPSAIKQNPDLPANDEKFENETFSALIEALKDILSPMVDPMVKADWVESDALPAIPFVGLVISLCKIAKAAIGYRFAKKLHSFINEVYSGSISSDQKVIYIKMMHHPVDREKIVSELIDTIDRLRDEYRSEIYARLFIAFIQGKISWESLVDTGESLEKMHRNGMTSLQVLSISDAVRIPLDNSKDIQKFPSKGIREYSDFQNTLLMAWGLAYRAEDNRVHITAIGRRLAEYGLSQSEHFRDSVELLRNFEIILLKLRDRDFYWERETEDIREYYNSLKTELELYQDDLIWCFGHMSKDERRMFEYAHFDDELIRNTVCYALAKCCNKS